VGQGGKGEKRDGDPSEGGGHDGTTIDSSLETQGPQNDHFPPKFILDFQTFRVFWTILLFDTKTNAKHKQVIPLTILKQWMPFIYVVVL